MHNREWFSWDLKRTSPSHTICSNFARTRKRSSFKTYCLGFWNRKINVKDFVFSLLSRLYTEMFILYKLSTLLTFTLLGIYCILVCICITFYVLQNKKWSMHDAHTSFQWMTDFLEARVVSFQRSNQLLM